jgi:hypothetical protein
MRSDEPGRDHFPPFRLSAPIPPIAASGFPLYPVNAIQLAHSSRVANQTFEIAALYGLCRGPWGGFY